MSVHSLAERETNENPTDLTKETFYFQLDNAFSGDLEEDHQSKDIAGSVGVIIDAVQEMVKATLKFY